MSPTPPRPPSPIQVSKLVSLSLSLPPSLPLSLPPSLSLTGGLDISPIAAFFTLNLLTSSVAALGATGPLDKQPRLAGPAAALVEKVRAQQ